MASFKVGVKTARDTDWAYNGLRFDSHAAAEHYAEDLFWRWTAVREYTITPSTDQPNRWLASEAHP